MVSFLLELRLKMYVEDILADFLLLDEDALWLFCPVLCKKQSKRRISYLFALRTQG
jgi:hypothetical protein